MQEAMRILAKDGYLDGTGETLLDIGTNIGMTCIGLLKAGCFQRAIAFEPAPDAYRFLVRNIAQNGFDDKIRAFPWALSSRSGTCQMEITEENSGDNRMRMDSQGGFFHEDRRRTIDVTTKTLDALVAEFPDLREAKIDLVWVDIQCHEGHFFRGAESFLQRGIPVVSEFWPYGILRSGTSEAEFGSVVSRFFAHYYLFSERPATRRNISEISSLFERFRSRRDFGSVLWVRERGGARPYVKPMQWFPGSGTLARALMALAPNRCAEGESRGGVRR
jgi:FkbM family methyltransferase